MYKLFSLIFIFCFIFHVESMEQYTPRIDGVCALVDAYNQFNNQINSLRFDPSKNYTSGLMQHIDNVSQNKSFLSNVNPLSCLGYILRKIYSPFCVDYRQNEQVFNQKLDNVLLSFTNNFNQGFATISKKNSEMLEKILSNSKEQINEIKTDFEAIIDHYKKKEKLLTKKLNESQEQLSLSLNETKRLYDDFERSKIDFGTKIAHLEAKNKRMSIDMQELINRATESNEDFLKHRNKIIDIQNDLATRIQDQSLLSNSLENHHSTAQNQAIEIDNINVLINGQEKKINQVKTQINENATRIGALVNTSSKSKEKIFNQRCKECGKTLVFAEVEDKEKD